MKRSAIARIVIYSIVAVILTSILVAGLTQNLSWETLFSFAGSYQYENSDRYLTGPAQIPADSIREVEVDWISGQVNILCTDEDTIQLTETSSHTLSAPNQMRYDVSQGKLRIRFYAPRGLRGLFGSRPSKTLTLTLPRSMMDRLTSLSVHTASANIHMTGITAGSAQTDTASGDIVLTDLHTGSLTVDNVSGAISSEYLQADRIALETVSGTTNLSGAIGSIDAETVSGRLTVSSSRCPERVEMETVSGDLTLTIPENDGFTARYDSVSGKFQCAFPASASGRQTIYGNGKASFSFDSVSGNISILRSEDSASQIS